MISGEDRSGTGNMEMMLETGEAGETTSACRSWAERRRHRAELGAGDAKAETNHGWALLGWEATITPRKLFGRKGRGAETLALLSSGDCSVPTFFLRSSAYRLLRISNRAECICVKPGSPGQQHRKHIGCTRRPERGGDRDPLIGRDRHRHCVRHRHKEWRSISRGPRALQGWKLFRVGYE